MKLYRIIWEIIVLFIIFLVSSFSIYASDLEKIKLLTQNPKEEIHLEGYFSIPGNINPGEKIFSYVNDHNSDFIGNMYFVVQEYKYIGRTGEKTFEIEHIEGIVSSTSGPPKERNKISCYFDDKNPIELQIKPRSTNCKDGTAIYFKTISLQGNKLKYQIILPECLVNLIKK